MITLNLVFCINTRLFQRDLYFRKNTFIKKLSENFFVNEIVRYT